MPPICLFKQSALAQAVHMHHHNVVKYQNVQRIFSVSLCFMAMQSAAHAIDLSALQPEISNDAAFSAPQEQKTEALIQKAEQQKNDQKPRDAEQIEPNLEQHKSPQPALNTANDDPLNSSTDSEILLKQQLALGTIPNFQAITFDELENMPPPTVDQNVVNEIYQVAEQAQKEAENQSKASVLQANRTQASYVTPISASDMQAIQQAPINVDALMQSIQQENNIQVGENLQGQVVPNVGVKNATQSQPQLSVWQKIINRFKPTLDSSAVKVPRISVNVNGAPADLARNIDAKLSTYTQEAFEDYTASLPQLRILANQAAQAMGYYSAEFKFSKVSDSAVRVDVTPNQPVKITLQDIEFTGQGRDQPQFRIIPLIPEQEVGDLFNHGLYEQTKLRISNAASDNGYFDAYWRLHDAKVTLPDNTADIYLKYETGERYQLGQVEFRMSDPTKPLPLDLDILNSLAPWQAGDDYAFWRVNTLANNLTNSRYFNYTLVDSIRPDPISKPLELAPDLQALADQEQMQRQQNVNKSQAEATSSEEVQQNVVDEANFAGVNTTTAANANTAARALQVQQTQKSNENELLQQQARLEKKIPVVVTLNADKLNSLETGLGYGTDTGVRLRSQYRRSIVNKRGHAFDSNIELSQIRQSLDARYSIPYHHPLNDYLNLITGYERETRDDIGPSVNLMTEALVLGAERVIKNPIGDWQHNYGLRYRLDRLTQEGIIDANNIPDEFRLLGTEQQSLLLSYETSKTDSDNAVNPTVGLKQSYKIEVGSKSLLSDTNMAILSAGWRTIYSLGENKDHQVLGRADAAYILSNDFEKVPYNLRYFTGGDQTIRGFDYKSLGPQIDGFKIGGEALAVGSLEYNYQFRDGWRAAVFSDFGNAYDEKFSNPTAYSAGVGLRWKSPIGPIRIDVASGISDPNHPIRLHFFIGPQL